MANSKKVHLTVIRQAKWHDKSSIEVRCDGRKYEPDTEAYHPIYSYKIRTKDWEYFGNDIHGGANEKPNVVAGMQSLIAFLVACAEARTSDSENFSLFPEHVREWAIHAQNELELKYATVMEDKKKEKKEKEDSGPSNFGELEIYGETDEGRREMMDSLFEDEPDTQ